MQYLEIHLGQVTSIVQLENFLCIGRNADLTLFLDHANQQMAAELSSISKKHVSFVLDRGKWIVVDGDNKGKRSLNGIKVQTLIGGTTIKQKVLAKELEDGDKVLLSDHIFCVYHDSSMKDLIRLLRDESTVGDFGDESQN